MRFFVQCSSLVAGCYKLTPCDSNSSRQNISQYGLMLIVSSLNHMLPIHDFLKLLKKNEAMDRKILETVAAGCHKSSSLHLLQLL